MGRLGDVLEALYEAPRRVGALHLRAEQVVERGAVERVFEWWREQQDRGGGSASLLITTGTGDDANPEGPDRTRHELWRAGPDAWRADTDDLIMIRDEHARRTYSPAVGGLRAPAGDRSGPPWSTLLHPRWLIDRADIQIGASDVVAGRSCWWLELEPPAVAATREPMAWLPNPFMMPPWLGTRHSCWVDQETGIVLAIEGRFEGEVCSVWTTTDFELVERIDPAVFAFLPPDGQGFRNAFELHIERLRESGVDFDGIDGDDEHAINEAMMRHHRRQFGVEPEALAEQYVPTGPPPDDPDAAEAQLRDAFERIVTPSDDGEAVPTVEGGANLGPCLRDAGTRAPGGLDLPTTITVEHVKFLAPDEAVVWFTLLRGGQMALGPVEGRGRRFGDRWLVSRATFARIVASVGVRCPPPPET